MEEWGGQRFLYALRREVLRNVAFLIGLAAFVANSFGDELAEGPPPIVIPTAGPDPPATPVSIRPSA